MVLKLLTLIIIILSPFFADDIESIFLGKVDRNSLVDTRVTVSGFVSATGCEKLPCKLRIKRKVVGVYVLLNLTFKDLHQKEVSRKKVLDPIVSSCIYKTPFEYEECSF